MVKNRDELLAELSKEIDEMTPEDLLEDLRGIADNTLANAMYSELFYGRLNIYGENPRDPNSLSIQERREVMEILNRRT